MKVAITGAAGRMGQNLVKLISIADDMQLAAVLEHAHSPQLGNMIGDVTLSSDMDAAAKAADVIIDFSVPAALPGLLAAAQQHGTRLVIGTTGLSAADEAAITNAAKTIPIVYSGNFSLGVNVLSALVERAAAVMSSELFDIEIFETHHKHKVDAPSGTALLLGRSAAQGRNVALDNKAVRSRDGHTGARTAGDIGFSVARGGNVAGDHTVFFFGEHERLELTHRATDSVIFARGALHAARWLMDQPIGLYNMRNVLKL